MKIEYLPPYSPDLNPIEEAFSKIKHFIRRHNTYYEATVGDGILFDMYEVTLHQRTQKGISFMLITFSL